MRTLDALIVESPVFDGLDQDQLELIAGCAQNVVFPAGERLFREGDPADTFFLVRHGLVAIDVYVPNRGQLTLARRSGPARSPAGRGSCRPTAGTSPAARVELVRAIQFDGACLRGKCDDDPRLGYALLSRFSQLLVDRLQATRLQLMDVYGNDCS